MKSNIALIGFMGTGKTAVGRVLAQKLNRRFVELDALIEKKAGKSIPEIFRQDGEIVFRELEIAVTKEVASGTNLVIACGGGIVLNRINIDRLRQQGIIVYLTATPAVILKRVSSDSHRPLLEVADRAQTIRQLLKLRRPFYEAAADIKIDTTGLTIDSVAEEIISRLKENEGFHL